VEVRRRDTREINAQERGDTQSLRRCMVVAVVVGDMSAVVNHLSGCSTPSSGYKVSQLPASWNWWPSGWGCLGWAPGTEVRSESLWGQLGLGAVCGGLAIGDAATWHRAEEGFHQAGLPPRGLLTMATPCLPLWQAGRWLLRGQRLGLRC
jgi:hypothetical protein